MDVPASYVRPPLSAPRPDKDIFYTIDLDGTISRSFGGGCRVLGVAEHELEGQSVFQVYADDEPGLERIRRGLQGESIEWLHALRGEAFIHRIRPRHDRDGAFVGIAGHATPLANCTEEEVTFALENYAADSLLPRGVWISPFLNDGTGTREVLLIGRDGRCVHRIPCAEGADPRSAALEAAPLLAVLDPAEPRAA
jgi:PAS domain-containing protein